MAYTTNVEQTYDHTASIRESLQDDIALMSPVTCPLQYHLGQGPRAGSTTIEWLGDYIAKPETTVTSTFGSTTGKKSAVAEGADAVFPAHVGRQRFANYTNIVRRAADISDTHRSVVQAAVNDEYSYKIWKAMVETCEQFDYNLHFGVAAAGSDATNGAPAAADARMLHGVVPWIFYTGKGFETGSATGSVTIAGKSIRCSGPGAREGYSGTWYTASATLTRSVFHTNMLEPASVRGMTIDGSVAFCSHKVKNVLSEFALIYDGGSNSDVLRNNRNISAEKHEIVDVVDVYRSNYGRMFFNMDRHLFGTETHSYDSGESPGQETIDVDDLMFILETDFWKIRMMRGLAFVPLAKVGDATKGMTVLEGTLQCSNPIAGICGNQLAQVA